MQNSPYLYTQLRAVLHICNPGTWKEEKWLGVQGEPQLLSKFKASLTCLKKKNPHLGISTISEMQGGGGGHKSKVCQI